jgi:hypothetical protein
MKITVTRGELKDAVQGFAKIITGKPRPRRPGLHQIRR